MDKIFIKGLELLANVGIYPHEKAHKQPILVDLDLYIDSARPAASGLISDTVDYDIIVRRVTEIVGQKHYELLETLAQVIADVILTEFKVLKLSCALSKPSAVRNAQSVGLVIERAALHAGA